MGMTKRCIITIGREYGSGGRIIGEMLAEKLGIAFYDRKFLEMAAIETGYSEDDLSEQDEFIEKKYFPYKTENLSEELFEIQSRIMIEKAKSESCVIVGRCSDIILKDFANVVHVFIYADEDDRIQTIMKRNNLDEVKARKEMKKVLSEIQDGTFASEFMQEFSSGRKAKFLATRRKESEHLLEKVGAGLRKMMSWLKK